MSVRMQWSVAVSLVILAAAVLLALSLPRSGSGFGAVRAVIEPGSTDEVVDVALIDSSGQEYAGDDRGAGESETLPVIPAGRVQVNVGTCSSPAVVTPGRTVVVRFDPMRCIR